MRVFRELLIHSVRERLSNLGRDLLAGALFMIPPVTAAFAHGKQGMPGETSAVLLSLAFGAGLIGPDAASGVLQLVLTRPITRTQYVLARWLAAAGLTAGAAVVQVLVVAVIMSFGKNAPGWNALGGVLVMQVSVALGVTAVLAAFSSFTDGFGDLRTWILVLVLSFIAYLGGELRHAAWLTRLGTEVEQTVVPAIDHKVMTLLAVFPFAPAVAWLSTVTLSLTIAIVALNRKELSHGGS